MKIKKKYIWNIERKSKKYWFSFTLLLIPCLFKISILYVSILYRIYICIGIDIDTKIFGSNDLILRMFDFILLIFIILLIIISVEVCFSVMEKKQSRGRTFKSLYSFIYSPQFKVDVFILGIIIFMGILEIYLNMDIINTNSWIFFLLSALLLIGIYINVSCIFPWSSYREIQNILKEKKDDFQEAWLCISTYTEISTFSLLPGACKEMPIVVTEKEILILNQKKNCDIQSRDFNKLLILLSEKLDREKLRNMIEKYSSYLHMRCFVILENELQNNQYEKEINILKERMDAQIIYKFQNIYSLNILEEYLGIKYSYNVVKCLNQGNSLQNMGQILDDIYLNIIHGPVISVKFFKLCLMEPNLSKAIYMFFDYIDLQYRLVCAFFAPMNLNWYVQKSNHIGNFRKMFKFIVGNLKDLTTIVEIEKQYILNDHMCNILQKYLSNGGENFGANQKLSSEQIKNLCAELRNKLRGHQDIILEDVPVLLNLVFRLAVATNYLLGINQMVITYEYNGKVMGNYKDEIGKSLSPFIELDQECLWIFNNAKKENNYFQMEYVDFLTGKVKVIKKENI